MGRSCRRRRRLRCRMTHAANAQAALNAGRPAEALAWLQRALEAEPESAELRRECARVAWMMGDFGRASTDCRAALDRAPADVAAWNLLGEILRSTDAPAAERAWRRAIGLAPDNAEPRFHLGNLYRERGDLRAARREYERALAAAPRHAGVLNNLGLALEAAGERDRAEACYERVLAASPGHPDALGNLASSQFEREAYRQSALTYERLFAIRSDVPAPVWVRRGLAQQRLGDLVAAEASFREAARLAPDDPRIQQNLGTVCFELQRHADAEPAWLRVLELRPESAYAMSMLAFGRQYRCDWRGLSELHVRINRLLETDDAPTEDRVNPFHLLTMPTSPAAQLRAAELWARGIAPSSPALRPSIALARGERLRVGFVSSDFRAHPMVLPVDRVLGGHRSRSFRDLRVRDSHRRSRSARAARGASVRSLRRRERRTDRRDRRADPRRSDRGARRSQRLHAALARADLRAAAGTRSDQLPGLPRHAGRRLVRLCAGRPVQRARRAAAILYRTAAAVAAHVVSKQSGPASGRSAADPRRMRTSGRGVRVRVLQQRFQDPARRLSRRGCVCCAQSREACCGCSKQAPRRRRTSVEKPGRRGSTRSGSPSLRESRGGASRCARRRRRSRRRLVSLRRPHDGERCAARRRAARHPRRRDGRRAASRAASCMRSAFRSS